MMKRWWAVSLVLFLASCGGGGGDAGSSNFTGVTPSTGDTTGGTTTTTPTTPTTTTAGPASSITFTSASPTGTALTIKGAGGSGRTETATLTFKVVDAAGVPVPDVAVAFAVNTASDATLSLATVRTSSTGQAIVQVQSGVLATPVVVTATVQGVTGVATQSDSILVSQGVAIAAGFEMVSDTYNLDGGVTGDSATLTIYVRDANGNLVADGLPVSVTTDFGAVGSAGQGGCTTLGGLCTVDFRVQDPRGSGIATVTARALVGETTVITDAIQIYMASASGYRATLTDVGRTTFSTVALSAAAGCRATQALLIMDANGRAPAAGTAISTGAPSASVSASVLLGSPVDDQLGFGSPPSPFTMDISSGVITTGPSPTCQTGSFVLLMETPSGRTFQQTVTITSAP